MAQGDETTRLTIQLPADLHDAFFLKCRQAKPRTTMKQRIVEFIAREVGKPVPKFIDRRRLTYAERRKLDDKGAGK